MADPSRISALIVARDEAKNLPDCLASLSWCDETIVVVDAASLDETEAIARALATRCVVRRFDDFAAQRNAALALANGDWVLAVDADERATPELAAEIRAVISTERTHSGYRVPIRSVVLGRPFRFSGTQHDLPLRLFQRDRGRWVGEVHETVDLEGTAGRLEAHLTHRTIPDMQTFLRKINHYTTLEAARMFREGARFRVVDVMLRPVWVFAKLYLGKQGFRDGLEGFAFCALSGLSSGVRHWKLRELLRVRDESLSLDQRHDAEVSARFDACEARFKPDVSPDDVRLAGVLRTLEPVDGKRILDLGCGKGRFAARLTELGADVVGVDLSAAMLAKATGLARARASARRLPFADGSFDAVVAIEVLEHVGDVNPVLAEIRRVLRPGGTLAILDKNASALDARRPWLPALVIKRLDEWRGRWMYPVGGPVRERWFWPERLRKVLNQHLSAAQYSFLIRPEEASWAVFRLIPRARLWTLWSARVPEERPRMQLSSWTDAGATSSPVRSTPGMASECRPSRTQGPSRRSFDRAGAKPGSMGGRS
jgi:SAM-dependent methyltransferase